MSTEVVPHSERTALERARFRRLRMVHQRILSLHLKGFNASAIANATRVPEAYIRGVLGRDEYKPILTEAYEARLKQLLPRAVDALDRNMRCGDPNAEIRAADVVLKANGQYEGGAPQTATAENIIERILERISPDGTTTRAIERRVINLGGLSAPPTD